MVACSLLFRPRANEDLNNFNFITDIDPIPNATNGFGLPLFREVTHSDFVQQPAYEYKQLASDPFGYYTTFLIHSGARKLRQTQVQVTIKQRDNQFDIPVFFIGIFGLRPGTLDTNKNFVPFYDYFTLDRSNNMTCDNVFDELSSTESASVPRTLIGAGIVPDTIEYSPSGIYRNFPLHDGCLFNTFETTSSVQAKNDVFTTHDLAEPIFNHLPDLTSFGPNVILQAKLNVYPCYVDYTLGTTSKMRLFGAFDVVSLGGSVDII
jgi:hypothetical protein